MKKILLVLFIAALSANIFAQEFDSSKLRVGGGLVYATQINNIGLTFNGVYEFTNEWEGAVGYSHIFKKNNTKYNILDFDAHYIFYEHDSKLNVYGIGGIGLTFAKTTFPATDVGWGITTPEIKTSYNSFGINLGIGANYKLSDQFNLAPEMRLTITDGTYFRIGATVQYLF